MLFAEESNSTFAWYAASATVHKVDVDSSTISTSASTLNNGESTSIHSLHYLKLSSMHRIFRYIV